MAHKPEIWAEIKARYEAGEGVRELSRKFKIANSGIVLKARQHNWQHGKNEQLINETLKSEQNIKKDIHDKNELDAFNKVFSERRQIADQIHNLSKGVLSVSRKALRIADENLSANNDMETAGKSIYIAEKANNTINKTAELYGYRPTESQSGNTQQLLNADNNIDIAQQYQDMINAL